MTTNPDGAFMAQVARNLTDSIDGFLRGKKYLVIDRDTKFTEAFRKTLAGAGVETVLTAVRAQNMNAIAKRFVKTIKDECLSKVAVACAPSPGQVPQLLTDAGCRPVHPAFAVTTRS